MDKLAAQGGTPVRTTGFPDRPQYDDAERSAVLRVLDSRNWWATEGVEVRAFETEWSTFTGASGAVAVTNGTQALEVALSALDIGQGDEVIVPDWSFMATIGAVLAVNAIPVIVDVDPRTGTIDVAAAAAAVTDRTRALLPVHLGGNMADLDGLRELAGEHSLVILEDAAQAHGSSWQTQHAGTLGDAGTFSFQASKNMTAGEGGVVVARSSEVLRTAGIVGQLWPPARNVVLQTLRTGRESPNDRVARRRASCPAEAVPCTTGGPFGERRLPERRAGRPPGDHTTRSL